MFYKGDRTDEDFTARYFRLGSQLVDAVIVSHSNRLLSLFFVNAEASNQINMRLNFRLGLRQATFTDPSKSFSLIF